MSAADASSEVKGTPVKNMQGWVKLPDPDGRFQHKASGTTVHTEDEMRVFQHNSPFTHKTKEQNVLNGIADDWEMKQDKQGFLYLVEKCTGATVYQALTAIALDDLYLLKKGNEYETTSAYEAAKKAYAAWKKRQEEGTLIQDSNVTKQETIRSSDFMSNPVPVGKTTGGTLSTKGISLVDLPPAYRRFLLFLVGILLGGGAAALLLNFVFPAAITALVGLLALTGLAALVVPLLIVAVVGASFGLEILSLLARAITDNEQANYRFMRNLFIITALLGGGALGVFLAMTTPVVLGATVSLVGSGIGAYALAGAFGLVASGLLALAAYRIMLLRIEDPTPSRYNLLNDTEKGIELEKKVEGSLSASSLSPNQSQVNQDEKLKNVTNPSATFDKLLKGEDPKKSKDETIPTKDNKELNQETSPPTDLGSS